MDNLLDIFYTYYSTISKTGYIPIERVKELLVLDFIDEIVNLPEYYLFATCIQRDKVGKIYECITKNNCLL